MADIVKTHSFECNALPIEKVVVFSDRAEVRRVFSVTLDHGLNQVDVQNVPHSVLDSSVGVTGQGAAVIVEVQVKDRQICAGESDSARVAQLRVAVDDAKAALAVATDRKNVLAFRLKALDECVNQMGQSAVKTGRPEQPFAVNENSLQNITDLFSFHENQSLLTREALRAADKEVEKASEKLNVAENELHNAQFGSNNKSVSFLLESAEGGQVDVTLSYQTWNASWQPFYDVRVDTQNEKKMEVAYQANVQQSSGEDWEGGQLILSTAQPCMGCAIPELGTLDVAFYVPPPPPQIMAFGGGGYAPERSRMMRCGMAADEAMTLQCSAVPKMINATTAVSQQALSTEFLISRPAAIPSDGANHKVTIGEVCLAPELVHETVPGKTPSVFLTASAINTSALALLAGPAAIYLDGAFVARSELKAVSPGERFSSSLGVDSAVKIEYKPAHRFNNQAGMINKTNSLVHEQKIVVKNTKSDDILLTLREHIPRSTDEKIKLKIISPDPVEHPTEEELQSSGVAPSLGARLLPATHNLEWTVRVEKGTALPLSVKWQIDHPHSEKLSFDEKF